MISEKVILAYSADDLASCFDSEASGTGAISHPVSPSSVGATFLLATRDAWVTHRKSLSKVSGHNEKDDRLTDIATEVADTMVAPATDRHETALVAVSHELGLLDEQFTDSLDWPETGLLDEGSLIRWLCIEAARNLLVILEEADSVATFLEGQ